MKIMQKYVPKFKTVKKQKVDQIYDCLGYEIKTGLLNIVLNCYNERNLFRTKNKTYYINGEVINTDFTEVD